MREEKNPAIADVVMDLHLSLCSFNIKVGTDISNCEAWHVQHTTTLTFLLSSYLIVERLRGFKRSEQSLQAKNVAS